MSSSILEILKSKGIEIASSLIPGGALVQSAVKSIATSLLGDENASEGDVKNAILNANPEQINLLKNDVEKLGIELKISEQKTSQEQEKTLQEEHASKRHALDFVKHIFGKNPVLSIAIYSFLFYFVMILALFYIKKYTENNDSIETAIIAISIIYITFPISIVYQPMYKIIDGISDSVVHVIKIPTRMIK